ncbi:MAG: radical SAM protein [Deltaproteobacteria bacterium]|nr:radical SAM protein [Deltaproteobacteria bacterium]
MELEQRFTSTSIKLLKQYERFEEWERGILRPISLQLAPTDRCNLACDFCSVKNRDGDELGFFEMRPAIVTLKAKGLKTVELTGGGDPTMYEDIEDLICFIHGQELEIGFITNGIRLSEISQRCLDMLTWIRISMNCLDYVDDIDMPPIAEATTLGFSYVVNDKMTEDTVTKILKKMDEVNVEYLRLVPNCLSEKDIKASEEMVMEFGLFDNPKVFYQKKKRQVPHHCRIGYLKPFLNADGYFYHCSANPLIDRKFHPDFRMGRIDEIDKIWTQPYAAFDTKSCQEGKCFFKEHNDFLDLPRGAMLRLAQNAFRAELKIQHRNFI